MPINMYACPQIYLYTYTTPSPNYRLGTRFFKIFWASGMVFFFPDRTWPKPAWGSTLRGLSVKPPAGICYPSHRMGRRSSSMVRWMRSSRSLLSRAFHLGLVHPIFFSQGQGQPLREEGGQPRSQLGPNTRFLSHRAQGISPHRTQSVDKGSLREGAQLALAPQPASPNLTSNP